VLLLLGRYPASLPEADAPLADAALMEPA
jgi:hypothetical protein